MKLVGIDYSLTSPAITTHIGTKWSIDNCTFYYLVGREKNMSTNKKYVSAVYPKDYKSHEERINSLSQWALDIIEDFSPDYIALEGYAFGARGSSLFQIAENTGLLKWRLWTKKYKCEVYPPTMIKKFATTKGNANKAKMIESFQEETKINIHKVLDSKSSNPASDIVDSYFICKKGFHETI